MAISAPDLKSINRRQRILALLHIAGMKNKDIASALGYTESRVSIILGSPLMQEQIEVLRGEVDGQLIEDARAILNSLVIPSLVTLNDARANGESHTVRANAATALLDRHPQFGKKSTSEGEHTVRLVLGPAELAQMRDAHEATVIDAEPLPLPSSATCGNGSGNGSGLRSLHDAIADAHARLP